MPTRDEISARLVKGSVKKSYNPQVDIDWDTPVDPGKFFIPPETVSLYGTALWDEMTQAQRIDLSRHELANIISTGIWFENILNQSLLRKVIHQHPGKPSTHYALTEVGDETRHMIMFSRAIAWSGANAVRPTYLQRVLLNIIPYLFFRGPTLWVIAVVGEEIFDTLQRGMLNDERLQPLVREVMKIHVTEEARHIQFARDGLRRRVETMGSLTRRWVSNVHLVGGLLLRYVFTHRLPYHWAGLDADHARAVARSNPNAQATCVRGFAPLADFLEEVGLMGGLARRVWRRTGFLS